jgi:hypothetical protein
MILLLFTFRLLALLLSLGLIPSRSFQYTFSIVRGNCCLIRQLHIVPSIIDFVLFWFDIYFNVLYIIWWISVCFSLYRMGNPILFCLPYIFYSLLAYRAVRSFSFNFFLFILIDSVIISILLFIFPSMYILWQRLVCST